MVHPPWLFSPETSASREPLSARHTGRVGHATPMPGTHNNCLPNSRLSGLSKQLSPSTLQLQHLQPGSESTKPSHVPHWEEAAEARFLREYDMLPELKRMPGLGSPGTHGVLGEKSSENAPEITVLTVTVTAVLRLGVVTPTALMSQHTPCYSEFASLTLDQGSCAPCWGEGTLLVWKPRCARLEGAAETSKEKPQPSTRESQNSPGRSREEIINNFSKASCVGAVSKLPRGMRTTC